MFGLWTTRRWSPSTARQRILKGTAPERMRIEGSLNLAGAAALGSLPARLSATSVNVSGCANLRALPPRLECWELILRGSGVQNLPAGLRILERIDAEDCRRLRSVGAYQLKELLLRGCLALESLPEGLRAQRLDVSRCPLWRQLPRSVVATVEYLDVSRCPQLTALPGRFARLEGLNVADCANLRALPEGIRIRSWVDVGGSGMAELPWSLRSVRVMWHGVPVSDRIAFHPETITVDEILRERNQELRRVLLERVGMEWFFKHARPTILHEDRDAGGTRRLLRIDTREGEPVVCVQVQCPSTGSRYLLRVPPDLLTCHDAVAWTAGYRNSRNYRPVVET